MPIHLDYAQISCVGGREINEDSYACVSAAAGLLVVVADGLGGHGRGEMASLLLTDVFSREFMACPQSAAGDFLASAFESAQAEILQMQCQHHAPNEMKTTAAALVISDDTVRWAHCGDTRLYHFRKHKLKARTLDHSVPQMLVLAGEIKERHISSHPDRNKLLRVVGVPWDTPRYQLGEPVPLTENCAFLLCTDGFWEHIPSKTMEKYLKKTKMAEDWLALMKTEVERNAKAGGNESSMDNYTAAAVRVVMNSVKHDAG